MPEGTVTENSRQVRGDTGEPAEDGSEGSVQAGITGKDATGSACYSGRVLKSRGF